MYKEPGLIASVLISERKVIQAVQVIPHNKPITKDLQGNGHLHLEEIGNGDYGHYRLGGHGVATCTMRGLHSPFFIF